MTVPLVRLEVFEGPVELLLYLVRKNELDVADVPIAQLTDDFLAWVRTTSVFPMESASDFLVMAAVLLRLKVRQLLPRTPAEDLETPVVSLEQILDEFRRFQQVARVLSERESERRRMFPRLGETPRSRLAESEDLLLLTSALQRVLARLTPEPVARLAPLKLRIEDRIAALRQLVRTRGAVAFEEAVSGRTIAEVIVMFIAVLELVRLGELRVRQKTEFGTIQLEPRQPAPSENPDTPGQTPGPSEDPCRASPDTCPLLP